MTHPTDQLSEDRQLRQRILEAQRLHHQIEQHRQLLHTLNGSELVSKKMDLARLQRSRRLVLNELNLMLLSIDRFQKLHDHLCGKYDWARRNPVLWGQIWSKVIDDRLFWLNHCSDKRESNAPPAYLKYDPNYEGERGAASVWTWFSGMIDKHILNQTNTAKFKQSLEQKSMDAPLNSSDPENTLTLADTLSSPEKPASDATILVELLESDPDDVFTHKQRKSRSKDRQEPLTYKELSLRLAAGQTPEAIAAEIGVAPSTIYRRSEAWSRYYKPYLHESLYNQFWLPNNLVAEISIDKDGHYGKIVLKPDYRDISLRQIVQWKIQPMTWKVITQQLQPQPTANKVILFCLDRVEKICA